MKWIGIQTLYDNIRLSGNAKNIQIGDGTETLNLAGDLELHGIFVTYDGPYKSNECLFNGDENGDFFSLNA